MIEDHNTKTTIQFWSGTETIGGNIAEITYGKDRIIFDFGYIFYKSVYHFLEENKSRQEFRVIDLLTLHAIPPIDGIYRKDDLQKNGNSVSFPSSYEESHWNTAVLISHLHLDHMGAIDTIHENIPIFMSERSAQLFQYLITVGEEKIRDRPIVACPAQEVIHIGQIKVTPYLADHDIYGASSFLIETPDVRLMFTGDFYMHGAHPEWNESWITELAKKEIDILLLEGTSFRPGTINGKPLSGKDITHTFTDMLATCKGLAIVNMYHRNIERVISIIQAAHQANRIPVIEPETAYLVNKIQPKIPFAIFKRNDGRAELGEWEQSLYEKYPVITAQEINRHTDKYVLQNSFEHRYELLDLILENSIYVHSNGIPFGNFAVHFDTLIQFLKHVGIPYKNLNVSGHVTMNEAFQIIDRIKPKIVVPWHTMYPELMKVDTPDVKGFLPKLKKKYIYQQNQLV